MKSRTAYLCNLKLLLIVLVVLGHSLERVGAQSCLAYRVIYLFHMPLFAFVTGLHLKSMKSCRKQAKNAFWLYLLAQGVAVFVSSFTGKRLSLLTPYWHLWYLLSLLWWSLLAALCCKLLRHLPHCGWFLCLISVALALACGALPLGRALSASRTMVFFPYVLFGVLCPVKLQDGPNMPTRLSMAAFGVLCLLPARDVFMKVSYSFLYQASDYGSFHLTFSEGCRLRGLCLLAACGLGTLVMALIPSRKLPATKLGGDTLPAYLLHVLFLPLLSIFWPDGHNGWLPVFSFGVVLVLWELCRWCRPIYTVICPFSQEGHDLSGGLTWLPAKSI
ncbi:MAG: acyltransferase family protein [Faecousia sp.]